MRRVKDKCRDLRISGCEAGGQRGTYAYTVRNDRGGWDSPGGGEVAPRGLSVFTHALLAGVKIGAEAIAAIVEGE